MPTDPLAPLVIYFMFPAPAMVKQVSAARFNLLSRAGAYTGAATMTLEARSFDGTLMRTASVPVDLQAAAAETWIELVLSADSSNLVINPGEYLCAHFYLSAASGETLDVRPIFEVILR